jgi:tRNA(Ser,Leu) C12 N-acetylase TAN1
MIQQHTIKSLNKTNKQKNQLNGRENTQISKTRNEKVELTKNTTKIQGIIRDYFENGINKLENLEEMDKFLDTYDCPKLNQENINHINRFITCNEIEATIKSLPKKRSPNLTDFQLNSSRPSKKN